MSTYKIIRSYFNGSTRTIKKGLTLEDAQAHCRNRETSSRTATSSAAKQRTKLRGPWFDGYTEQ